MGRLRPQTIGKRQGQPRPGSSCQAIETAFRIDRRKRFAGHGAQTVAQESWFKTPVFLEGKSTRASQAAAEVKASESAVCGVVHQHPVEVIESL